MKLLGINTLRKWDDTHLTRIVECQVWMTNKEYVKFCEEEGGHPEGVSIAVVEEKKNDELPKFSTGKTPKPRSDVEF